MWVEDIKKEVERLNRIIEIMEQEPISLEDIIIRKYIELGRVGKVAEFINEQGHRISSPTGGRKYITNDISAIIEKAKDLPLQPLAFELLKNNRKLALRIGG